ncbi:MAG: VPLPA-CTERM sorting domain-containing protein [Gammaproteobacteria bacterium]|nr:VPLPA-CTERM sorting domain-containing protein [Gammaproteobacteria bacterium]
MSLLDSLLYHTFTYNGSATIKIADCIRGPATCTDKEISFNVTGYDLQISRSLSLSPIPVPAAVWLFGTALIGFVGMSRRTSVKA